MRRRGQLALAALAALPALAAAVPAGAALCPPRLRVGLPALGADEGEPERLAGIVPDLLQALSQRLGCALQVQALPRARALLDFRKGELELLVSVLRQPRLDALGRFLPYGYTEMQLLAGPAAPASLTSLSGLSAHPDLRVGLVRGIQHGPQLEPLLQRLAAQGRVEWASQFDNLATRLEAGRFALAAMPLPVHGLLAQRGRFQQPLREIEIPGSRPQAIGLYLGRSLAGSGFGRALEDRLNALVAEGRVRQMYVQHLGQAATERLFRQAAG